MVFSRKRVYISRLTTQWFWQALPYLCDLGSSLHVYICYSRIAVLYMFIRLIKCLMGPKINHDVRKLVLVSQIIKKKEST